MDSPVNPVNPVSPVIRNPIGGHVPVAGGLGLWLQRIGISALKMSLPYHDRRMAKGHERADQLVGPNIGLTLQANRQAVQDARRCLRWLEQQGFTRLGLLGTSIGSSVGYITLVHDPAVRAGGFFHVSTYFADVVWHGQSTRHIRAGLEAQIDAQRLRHLWSAISPMSYFKQFSRFPKKSLIVYASYDLTFLPQFSREVVAEFERHGLDHRVVALPCGHYTTGETPYKYVDGWQIASFLRTAFEA